MPWSPTNKLEWYSAIIPSAHIYGTASTANSLSGVDTILNNNESNNIYFSTNASTFLLAALELGNLFWAKYKYISLKYQLLKYPALISLIVTDKCIPFKTFHWIIFASKWKTAIVHPILKKAGLDLILSNFIPVSNLSFISKVVEKLVLAQFNKHCSIHSLIPNYQSAYRANYSCEAALTKIVNDILWAMEHQKVTSLVAIDLSAAFGTVDHDILLSVL